MGALTLPVFAQEHEQEETHEEAETQEQQEGKKEQLVQKAQSQLEKNKAEITAKEKQIAELEEKIRQLGSQRDSAKAQAQLAAHQLERIEQELQKAHLQLQQTQLSITETLSRITETEEELSNNEEAIGNLRQRLRTTVRLLYEHEQRSMLHLLLSSGSLAEVITEQNIYHEIQERMLNLIQDLRQRQDTVREQQTEFTERQQQLANLQQALLTQQKELKEEQNVKNSFVQHKQSQQDTYEQLISEAQAAHEEIKNDVFRLKNIGVEVSFTDAREAARFASSLTGVRAALLLAVVKVESNVGEWAGSGHFPVDMHPLSRDAFLRITARLGLDPHIAPISRRPSSYQGWGGAMGPAQIMPLTWERIEPHVTRLINKPLSNPYELTDALVATGILLAERGATDRAHEYEAVNRYLAGPNWIYHTWYGDRVLAVAKEYEQEGL